MRETDSTNRLVLVVEDNDDMRDMTRLALEALGYRVCEAENGEQAIAVACREQPNAILMDIGMPVLNGFTATARIVETRQFDNPAAEVGGCLQCNFSPEISFSSAYGSRPLQEDDAYFFHTREGRLILTTCLSA